MIIIITDIGLITDKVLSLIFKHFLIKSPIVSFFFALEPNSDLL